MRIDKDPEIIEVSDKNVKLRVVAFVLAMLIAVGAFTFAVSSCLRKTPGYHRIEVTSDEEMIRLAGRINFQYRFSGGNAAISGEMRQLQELYGASLRRCCRLLDASETYLGTINLAELNANRGRDMTLSEDLFEVLTDAYAKTLEGQGYSLFAGPLYAEWNSILILDDPQPFDPTADPEEAARIERLAALVRDPANFTFKVVDAEKRTVRFDVSEEVLACMREYELDCPILDLNLLHDAYLLRLIARDLEAQGYANGFLAAESGVTVSLSGHSGGAYSLLGFNGEQSASVATFPLERGTACSLLRAFPLENETYGYYTVEAAGETLYRHPTVPLSGEYQSVLFSCAVRCAEMDPVRAVYENVRLFACADRAAVEACAASLEDAAAWTLQEAGESVFSNAAAKPILKDGGYGWTME